MEQGMHHPTIERIIEQLESAADSSRLQHMARYGIDVSRAIGVCVPDMRALARVIRKGRSEQERHACAAGLWETGLHEARILASMCDAPPCVTEAQLHSWAADFNSWDLCDQCCNNLFRHTPHAYAFATYWSGLTPSGGEFVVRAGFALMACLAVGDKKATDQAFEGFWPLIEQGAVDGRNYVKKAVNWALRQLGKRNKLMHARAVATAVTLLDNSGRSATWIARDALRELQSVKILQRLGLPGG